MDSNEILELENKLLHPTSEPISLPLGFLESITSNFSKEQEIGSGVYGVVYKGLLHRGDSFIAVKKIHHSLVVQHDEQFQKEVISLKRIQHPNVIKLLGYCWESKGEMIKLSNGKCVIAEKPARMLCFEYMCNGGLDKHLSDESSGLEWNRRYEIIKGICNGLHFLHECDIIHLDLKPQNILMDSNMMPKIADFGLSRLLVKQKCNTVTVTSDRAGTIGYMAPEYINKGEISKKADIFSLGVIMIEILKGCREYPQSTETDIQQFIEKVLNNWRNRFERASKYTSLELHTQQVKQCIKIALKCMRLNRKKRPNALDIIQILDAAESTSCFQNDEDSSLEHQMGSHEGVLPQDVWCEDKLLALHRSEMMDVAPPARISEDVWNEETPVVAPPQPHGDPETDTRATECEIMELENKDPTAEPVSLPLGFLRSITDDFCDERKIGQGAYGVVYKGILPCGSVIAIKKFHERILMGDDRSFKDEASFLMDIEHQNVVQLLGYCAESSGVLIKQPNRKGIVVEQLTTMLCFEYMCNGSLDAHLSDESSGLEWNTRYKIIKGICSGLKYLHERNIIHRDLKPQNILMDITMVPKIADFGLSRLLDEQKLYTVTSDRAGTLGYMAPEYIIKGEISKKADIFSLGVIIIEILGSRDGNPDYHLHTTDFKHFTDKVLSNWRNRFERPSKYTSPELHTRLVKQCIDIALECVHPDKEKRPYVSNIIEILNSAEKDCYHQNGEGLPVDHQMGTQEGLPTSGVLHEDSMMALKIALKDHARAWIKGKMKSAVAPLQPQHEPVLESVDGSLAALCYQGARNTSFWLVHKALASLEDNVLKDWAATINLGPSVETLERELRSVKVILEFTLGKVIHNLALEDTLMVLRELVYDAEDVLDEMEYFRIQGDLLDASQYAEGCAHSLDHLNVLPSVHDEPPKLRFDRDNASRRIEHIVEQMQFILEKVNNAVTLLGSDWSTAPNIAQSRPITKSESIEPKLYGRELMMKSIIDDITKGKYSCELLTVIPIVGPGGIGKTTLAQHIYHSGEVQEHFDVRVWTCVSFNFNMNKLIEEIQRYIPKVDHESSNGTASELIGQRLKNKRLLLVLDDIWDCRDEDQWKQLLVPFRKSQVQGNIIIVTTRFPAQAQIMARKKDHSIYLQGINNKEFKELFLEIIFGDDDQSRKDHEFLLETGNMIASRLKGSPLAAKTVGRLLKTQLDLVHWTRILESKEWEHTDGKNDIMPALKLSFEYLPSQLQQCFSYCALFPQDYEFERQELINFWIGQEVLHSSHGENKRVEDIGLSCLTELVNYGFFLENKRRKDRTCYIIHDLLHELAQKVSSLECLSIDSCQSQVSSIQVLPSIRHLSINIDDTSAKDRLTLKNCMEDFNTLDTRLKVEKLRTLMIFGEHHGCFLKVFGDLFRAAKALRVIFLSKASYDVEYLLHNFYNLLHLRYLRIESSIPYQASFPNKISRFYHMMVIDAKHCGNIIKLPRDMSNLVQLRHFLVPDDALHSSMPAQNRPISNSKKFMSSTKSGLTIECTEFTQEVVEEPYSTPYKDVMAWIAQEQEDGYSGKTPPSMDLTEMIAQDEDGQHSKKIGVHVIEEHKREQGRARGHAQDLLDVDDETISKMISNFSKMLNDDSPEPNYCPEYEPKELIELYERLALYRIRAYELTVDRKLAALDDVNLKLQYPSSKLYDEGFFEDYEESLEWYFDPELCKHAHFDDYQRITLRSRGKYLDWERYHSTLNTYEEDLAYVQYCEVLANETKWIEDYMGDSTHRWNRIEDVVYIQALEIAADFPNVSPFLVSYGFREHIRSMEFDHSYKGLEGLYFEIWKRVAKGKMSFREALLEVHSKDIFPLLSFRIKLELEHTAWGHQLKDFYDAHVAGMDKMASDDKALELITEAVAEMFPRQWYYLDYAKKKLGIAKDIGLISEGRRREVALQDNGENGKEKVSLEKSKQA